MLFSSTIFIYYFLPIIIFVYYIVLSKKRALQNLFLLMASLVFYAWGEPMFVLVLMCSIIINWMAGLVIAANLGRKLSKVALGVDIFFNLLILFIFKYLNFSISLLRSIAGFDIHIAKIGLPIGISFFTFQALSYVIDVYRQNGKAQTNLLNVGLYISFFPQLIAGPIVRYETVAHEISKRVETLDDFFDGFARFVIGLSKKVLLANSFAIVADQAFDTVRDTGSISALFGWLGAIAYTLQIFFDFSGYSDMAIGLGRMFGFHFLENFNYPYISTSISEFWRRWHISLGTWFRDYLYIPLGGNRCSKLRNTINLFIVWTLTGIWHGANYTFIIWGLMYFILIVVEKNLWKSNKVSRVISIFRWLYTIFFIVIGWIIFRAESLADAYKYMKNIFLLNGNSIVDGMFIGWLSQYKVLLCIGVLLSTPLIRYISVKTKDNTLISIFRATCICGLFVISVASLIGSSYNPFIYFNF